MSDALDVMDVLDRQQTAIIETLKSRVYLDQEVLWRDAMGVEYE